MIANLSDRAEAAEAELRKAPSSGPPGAPPSPGKGPQGSFVASSAGPAYGGDLQSVFEGKEVAEVEVARLRQQLAEAVREMGEAQGRFVELEREMHNR